jgi:hypothetical protein
MNKLTVLENEVKKLRREVAVLKRALVGRADVEGEYRQEFVEQIREISKSPGKLTEFKGKKDFLSRLDAKAA